MKTGFGHFDASHRENFIAALLLFAMELDEPVQRLVVERVRKQTARVELGAFRGLGREARLPIDEEGAHRRADLWLLFDAGVVLVEVKSHGRWNPESVTAQLKAQASGGRLVRTGQPIVNAILLAPRAVANHRADHYLSWSDLIRDLRNIESRSAVASAMLRHLEAHVERPIGVVDIDLGELDRAARTVACLHEFLRSCVEAVGGEPRVREIFLTRGDGEPNRWNGWAWHGVSVPFAKDGRRYRVGIYHYVETPAGQESAIKQPWLEAYEHDEQEPLVAHQLPTPSLTSESLDVARERFVAAWAKKATR
jgi:hypothetical protein